MRNTGVPTESSVPPSSESPAVRSGTMNCDGTVRINGDQDGNAFVYSKEATTTNNAEGGDDEDTAATPTSYKTVSADLGLI